MSDLSISGGIRSTTNVPADRWRGPYASVAAAMAAVPHAMRANRTVDIIENGLVSEYVWTSSPAPGHWPVRKPIVHDISYLQNQIDDMQEAIGNMPKPQAPDGVEWKLRPNIMPIDDNTLWNSTGGQAKWGVDENGNDILKNYASGSIPVALPRPIFPNQRRDLFYVTQASAGVLIRYGDEGLDPFVPAVGAGELYAGEILWNNSGAVVNPVDHTHELATAEKAGFMSPEQVVALLDLQADVTGLNTKVNTLAIETSYFFQGRTETGDRYLDAVEFTHVSVGGGIASPEIRVGAGAYAPLVVGYKLAVNTRFTIRITYTGELLEGTLVTRVKKQ